MIIIQLNSDLKFPDGTGFYPDVQNGQRGYNTDPARGADTFSPFRSDISMSSIFLPPHRDNWGHVNISVSVYSTLIIGSIVISGSHNAEVIGDGEVLGQYKNGDQNISIDISAVDQLQFRNGLRTTNWGNYVEFKDVVIK